MQRVLEAGCRSWGGVLHPNVPCMRPAGRSELELVFQASLTHPEERPLDCLPLQIVSQAVRFLTFAWGCP